MRSMFCVLFMLLLYFSLHAAFGIKAGKVWKGRIGSDGKVWFAWVGRIWVSGWIYCLF